MCKSIMRPGWSQFQRTGVLSDLIHRSKQIGKHSAGDVPCRVGIIDYCYVAKLTQMFPPLRYYSVQTQLLVSPFLSLSVIKVSITDDKTQKRVGPVGNYQHFTTTLILCHA